MHHLAILLIAIALTACSSTPVPLNEARFISEQLLFRDAALDTAPVIVRRDRGSRPICKSRVFVNNDLAAYLGSGEAVTLNIPASDVIIGADPGAYCAGGIIEEAVTLTPGKPVYFRIAYDDIHYRLMRTVEK